MTTKLFNYLNKYILKFVIDNKVRLYNLVEYVQAIKLAVFNT